jgi:hypothetical protein
MIIIIPVYVVLFAVLQVGEMHADPQQRCHTT